MWIDLENASGHDEAVAKIGEPEVVDSYAARPGGCVDELILPDIDAHMRDRSGAGCGKKNQISRPHLIPAYFDARPGLIVRSSRQLHADSAVDSGNQA